MTSSSAEQSRKTLARDDVSAEGNAPHPAGVRRVALIFSILVGAAVLPYAVPEQWAQAVGAEKELARLEAYRPGAPVPFSQMLTFRPPTRPTLAGVAEVQASLGDDVLADAPLAPTTAPAPVSVTPEVVTVAPAADSSRLRIPPEAYANLPLPIAGEAKSMERFYRSLRSVARREDGAKARILVYSDSINGSDRVSHVLREGLQARFGDGGKGWVPATRGWQSHRTQDVVRQSSGFQAIVLNRGERESGWYGLGGVVARDSRGKGALHVATVRGGEGAADFRPGTQASRIELYFEKRPGGGDIRIVVDGEPAHRLGTAATDLEAGHWTTTVADGAHSLDVSTATPPVHLYGVVLERTAPGVVVDGLALIGAFTRVLGNWNQGHWQQQLRQRDPSLVIFWLGGNDSVSDQMGFHADQFVDRFAEILSTAKAANDASCLVLSVLDSAREVDGEIRSRRRVSRVVRAQQQAAERAGCAFWNGYQATGGRGTAARWFLHRPKLLGVDYRHLTRSGAKVYGTLLERALLHGYDHWLALQETEATSQDDD